MGNCLTSKRFPVHPADVPTTLRPPERGGCRIKVRMTAGQLKELMRRASTETENMRVYDATGYQLIGREVIEGCMQGKWEVVSVGSAPEEENYHVHGSGPAAAVDTYAGNYAKASLPTIAEED